MYLRSINLLLMLSVSYLLDPRGPKRAGIVPFEPLVNSHACIAQGRYAKRKPENEKEGVKGKGGDRRRSHCV